MKKIMLGMLCIATSSFGLEFGSMGQVSASMGGAGVALKDSAWGLYYNPALLGADRRSKVGFSFGAQIKEQNLAEVATIDVDNLNNLPQTLNGQLLSGGGASVSIGGTKIDGALGGALNALIPSPTKPGTIEAADLSKVLTHLDATATTCNSFADCATTLKNNTDLANKFKDKLAAAATEGGSPLVGSIIAGIDASNLGDVLEKISQGAGVDNVASDILESAGGLTLSKGADSKIDKLLNDFEVIDRALKNNDVNVSSQNGFVFQIAGDKKQRRIESDKVGNIEIQEVDSGRGAVGFGVFASAFSNASLSLDPSNNKLIFDLGGKYYEANVSGDNITLTFDQNRTDLNGSIMNDTAKHTLNAQALALIEVPLGYGHTLFTPMGDINIGAAAKFIQGMNYSHKFNFSVGNVPDFDINKDNILTGYGFGLDVGVLYTPRLMKNFHIGLVAKNINNPSLKMTDKTHQVQDFTLHRQVRAGVSYEMLNFLTFAFDADILPNDTLSLKSPQSQFLGGGVMANFKFIDLRLGAMQDIRSNAGEGLILTGGANLLGFLDVAVQYGLGQNITLYDINLSNYMSVRVGGQFSF
ncbi:conjugal transfer protein TraF [Helicobacter sp. MIT 21-1697]|uniref:conjugal transfer protein TraF n=1 Tax=Helicobacter sp. MIT 21-1697 TaxID=2993733 RepID=UPI00224B6F25|nr:conjugal transfer protein TraF [Helicobacter sp. MIT 21-1697]MCX2717558.1 conjugal transfer protein TraF [Helicobacter sp. MIT 21-1697]